VHVCVCVCVRACVRACMWMFGEVSSRVMATIHMKTEWELHRKTW